MAGKVGAAHVQLLPDTLWATTAPARRSTELTPLYLDRYTGWRTSRQQTYHDFWELICNRGAPGHLSLKDRDLPLHQHHIVLLPPRTPHMEYSDRSMDLIWMGLHGTVLSGPGSRLLLQAWSQELSEAVEKTWLFSRQSGPIGPELDGMARSLLGKLQRLSAGAVRAPAGDLVARGIRAIHERLAEPLFVASLAHSLGCSEGHFHRTFRRGTGKTPIEYLTDVRVEHAMRLLADTGWSVARISETTGYTDPFYFSRVFKKRIGVSPMAYRLTRLARP